MHSLAITTLGHEQQFTFRARGEAGTVIWFESTQGKNWIFHRTCEANSRVKLCPGDFIHPKNCKHFSFGDYSFLLKTNWIELPFLKYKRSSKIQHLYLIIIYSDNHHWCPQQYGMDVMKCIARNTIQWSKTGANEDNFKPEL